MSFHSTAEVYDAIYQAKGKDYAAEAATIRDLIAAETGGVATSLLDVGCGTGGHLEHFAHWYDAEGVDLEPAMLDIARRKLPEVPLHLGDMATFDLGRRFDAVVCLFSVIGYATTIGALQKAIANMAGHLADGGVLIVEPWFSPDEYEGGTLHSQFVDEPELRVARMVVSQREGRLSVMDMHHLIGTPAGIQHVVERHEMGLFTVEEFLEALRSKGLAVRHEPEGIYGRGLFVARR